MHFNSLRLQGFKSFVDPTELVIDKGLTGIVGPNGCGKSNLVEALRWVMGETSPKRMRGAEMDDVIFAGTAVRPSRNLAEVQLHLDNGSRTAAAEYNDSDDLAVIRKIERGGGSDYRINGKPVRQRDVHLLFADHATGAHATNVVGQGQIDALIRAKPQDRRQILEEASGTSGLQSRRHEAELKLKAAEQNLTRLDDVLRTLDTQLKSLKQQVRQASRYRNLAEHIRRTEATLLHLRWIEAENNAKSVHDAMAEAERVTNELLVVVTQGTTQRTEIAAEMPGLRQIEATAAAIVQKLTLAREQIDAEAKRVETETNYQQQLLDQTKNDRAREQERQQDGITATAKLADEKTGLCARLEETSRNLPDATTALESICGEVRELDAALHAMLEMAANTEAKQQSLMQEIAALTQRQSIISERRDQLDSQRAALAAEIASRPDLSLAKAMMDACETELEKRQAQAQQAEQARRDADAVQMQKREEAQTVSSLSTRLEAEADAIKAMLEKDETSGDVQAVIDLITVAPGLEKALAVALGEALTASLDSKAAQYWRELPAISSAPALPSPATQITQYIQAPAALALSLSQIGLVDDAAQGEEAAKSLQIGQIIVSRDGWAWRWDGFTVTPQAKTSNAVRLQQRNRLAALQIEIAGARSELEAAQAELDAADRALNECQELDRQTRAALQTAFAALNDARDNFSKQEREASSSSSKLASLDETLQQIIKDLEEIRDRANVIEDERRCLPDIAGLRLEIASSRAVLAEKRNQQSQKQSERDQLARDQQSIIERQATIDQELAAWQLRMESATAQISSLDERIVNISAELEQLRTKPEKLAADRAELLDMLSDAEAKRKDAADAVMMTEQQLDDIETQLKRDEAALGNSRENRVRAEAAIQAANEHFSVLRERMEEKLNCAPEELPSLAPLDSGENAPSVFDLEQTLGKYNRERDNMGPVNLRAEVEAETAQNDIDKLQKEKEDLVAAIAKLRQGIGQLNREARERLQTAFNDVNERFQVLFKRLFTGGKARLELIDDEDPMNAGLEIFAAPPGKKQQILSLLSGGERTLTAIALLFAVFQTNPSPICVLDEAEAALDESNISRFCDLVEEIVRETGTRFLIITHHRLTMARMDRLYGVTMSEKGVSQLVSVDLNSAVAMRDNKEIDNISAATEALEEVRAA
ncbi:MAG: chromosome segregation protein SMC [Alphaproteobacteria bacterium]|nr:chromosome segregation protein SMC [Alphaproteobacteria bacterium]